MSIREARLPADEPAILSFIDGLQDYEAAFEPDRRRHTLRHQHRRIADYTAATSLRRTLRYPGFHLLEDECDKDGNATTKRYNWYLARSSFLEPRPCYICETKVCGWRGR